MFHFNNKQIKRILIISAALFLFGLAGINNKTYAASNSTIGIVDFQLLISQHPDMAASQEAVKAEADQDQKDFNEKSATMTTDQEKQAYFNQLQQRLNEKKQTLFDAIRNKVIAAVKSVADAKGMNLVVDKSAAIYGGEDITVEVGKKITGVK